MARKGRGIEGLPRSPFPQRYPASGRAENQMVHELDADNRRGFGHAPREEEILRAGSWIAAWVGMEEHDAARAAKQALLEDFAGLDSSPMESAAIDLLL